MTKLINIVGTEFNFTLEECKFCPFLTFAHPLMEDKCALGSKKVGDFAEYVNHGFPDDCPLPDVHIGKTCTPEHTWVDKFFENPLI
jgi:hypothetical protein